MSTKHPHPGASGRPASHQGHIPVLPEPVEAYLGGGLPGVLVDCTVGLGGHAGLLLERDPTLKLIGLDVDEGNLALAREHLSRWQDRVRLVRSSFVDLGSVLADLGIEKAGGVLADLGLSSNQIADAARGFSFEVDGPLDMRMDRRGQTTAADLVNSLCEGELADLLYLQSQEHRSRRIAKRICQARREGRLDSTVALARLVAAAVGEDPRSHRSRIHPATRTFMALRMSVNREIESLRALLSQLPGCLHAGGVVAVISFHSVEDRVVKEDFRKRSHDGVYEVLTRKPIVAGPAERARNPRSRSAKLRVARLQPGG